MDKYSIEGVTLGQHQAYVDQYDPSLLQPISRRLCRENLPDVRFSGVDIWTGYELSWLDPSGKPQIAIAEFEVPASSPNLIESKSFKYYLNSFNQTVCQSQAAFSSQLCKDLSAVAGAEVVVKLYTLAEFAESRKKAGDLGVCLDSLPVTHSEQSPSKDILKKTGSGAVESVWFSHLLKSNCPVTGQPDWASIWIGMQGASLAPESLLQYIVAFRKHQDFHENCVERIYADLSAVCEPSLLWVYARYTRRGGLDINPFRSSEPMNPPQVMAARQ